MINKKFIVIGLVALFITAVAGFIYYKYPAIQEQTVPIGNKAEVLKAVENFYREYMRAINTNENWVDLTEIYTKGRAQELLIARAGIFLNEAGQGKQRFVQIISPIIVRFYEIGPTQIKTLVDFELEERIIGATPETYVIEKFLTWEKVGDKWLIIDDIDRSDRFSEWAEQQELFTVQATL